MDNVRLVDLVIDNKWSIIDDMMDKMVAKKFVDKIVNYKDHYLQNGSFPDKPKEDGNSHGS